MNVDRESLKKRSGCKLKRDFYTDEEVAEMLHIAIETVRVLCGRGDFPLAEKLGDGTWIIPITSFSNELKKKRRRVLSEEIDDFYASFDDEEIY